MKMRKTLAFIMSASLTLGALAGCSQTTLNYSKEVNNLESWEGQNSTLDGIIKVNSEKLGINEQINVTANGYTSKDKSFVDMKFSDSSGSINIPELKVYVDGETSYISKSFFEEIYNITGQSEPEELSNISQEYIGITDEDQSEEVKNLQKIIKKPDGLAEFGKIFFGQDTKLDLPFTQNGREYSLNLDSNQAVNLGAQVVKELVNNIDNLNTTFNLGLQADEISQMKTVINDDVSFNEGVKQVKDSLDGSTIKSKEIFGDDSYTADIDINLQIKDFGNVSISMKSLDKKTDAKGIQFPTSTIKFTQDEFNKLMEPTNEIAEKTVATSENNK